MDTDSRNLVEAVKQLGEAHSELAAAYIRFSGQYAAVSQLIRDLDQPTLFTNEKETKC